METILTEEMWVDVLEELIIDEAGSHEYTKPTLIYPKWMMEFWADQLGVPYSKRIETDFYIYIEADLIPLEPIRVG